MRLECTFPMPELHLFHSRRKAIRMLRRLGFDSEPLGTDAQMWFAEGVAVVLIEACGDRHEEAALLAHEAVHVAEEWLRWLGEEEPADEERAYMVQCIAEPLLRAHGRWKRKHGRGA